MKISERVVRFTLIFLILLSLYLSYSIWLSPARKETVESTTVTENVTNPRAATDVFLPLRLVWHHDDGSQLLSGENAISHVQSEIIKGTIGKIHQTVTRDEDKYFAAIDTQNSVELLYEGSFLLSEYNYVYGLGMDLSQVNDGLKLSFTRVLLDFDKNQIRFLDYVGKNVYEGSLTIAKDKVLEVLGNKNLLYYPVTADSEVLQRQYCLTDDIKMKKYSYILASQPYTVFQNAFFQEPDDVHTTEGDQELVYSSEKNETMIITENTGTVFFSGKMPEESESELIDAYSESYHYINRLGSGIGNVRYFDTASNVVTYRTYVEGFPVFSDLDKGEIGIGISQSNGDQLVQIKTSVDTIQVPIPADEEITLKSTKVVYQQLIDADADPEKIESLVVGYTWTSLPDTKQVVDLMPEWYVRYDKEWLSVNALIQKLPEMEVE